ncbi:hypothetical protein E2C01_099717 [Portunus trituberculatus]|uniref:Uncharacterized protein n=1 Tax=Portunus trituberculatus TaxID=210409 RepID=A0A5B7KG30_PORTR|nr:hypothetical protein [Portunus trituberculatus]
MNPCVLVFGHNYILHSPQLLLRLKGRSLDRAQASHQGRQGPPWLITALGRSHLKAEPHPPGLDDQRINRGWML